MTGTKLKRGLLGTFFVLAILCLLLPLISHAIPEGLNPQETQEFFKNRKVVYKDTVIKVGDRKMRFVCTGNDTLPMLLFIHGSPGSWDAYKDYLADSGLRSRAFMVAVDRQGYGGSSHIAEPSLQGQVNGISAALQLRKTDRPITIIGHSYGGPVAVKFALQYSAIIRQVILISPTISPEIEENISWKRGLQKMEHWWIWHWAVSRDLKNCTIEMQPLPQELRIMEHGYAGFKVPILEIHGTNDALAPIGNQGYVQKAFKNAQVDTIIFAGKNHFINWTLKERMISIIMGRLKGG